jgi:hypothetical protein
VRQRVQFLAGPDHVVKQPRFQLICLQQYKV